MYAIRSYYGFGEECNVQVKNQGMLEKLGQEFRLQKVAEFLPFTSPEA